MQRPWCLLPPSQRESEHSEETSTQQAEDRVSEGVRNPKTGYGSDVQENPRREHNRHKIQGCYPSISSSAHRACAVTQEEQERHRENEREHEEQRCEKWHQRHPEILRRKGLCCRLCFLAFRNMRPAPFFSVIMKDTPKYARRSLGSLLCCLYRLLWWHRCALNHHSDAPFSCLTRTLAFASDANKGLVQVAPVRNKSEAMGSTAFQRSVRLAR
jgi:hypothetical protein